MRILSGIIVVASLMCFVCLLPYVIGVVDGSEYIRFARELQYNMDLVDRYYIANCGMIIISTVVSAVTAIRAFLHLW